MKLRQQNKLIKVFLIIILIISFNQKIYSSDFSIAALVNGSIITNYDLNARVAILKKQYARSGKSLKKTGFELKKQVLKEMIEEKIKLFIAQKMNLKIEKDDLAKAITMIEHQNGLREGSMKEIPKQLGYDEDILYSQISADIAWLKIVRGYIAPSVNISESEVNSKIEEIANLNNQFYIVNLSHLVNSDLKTANSAYKKVKNIKDCSEFNKKAKELGESGSGSIGELNANDLSPEIQDAVKNLNRQDISQPVKTSSGKYTIFMLCDKKSTSESINEEIKNKIRMGLKQEEIEKKAYTFLNDKKREVLIEIKDKKYEDVLDEF